MRSRPADGFFNFKTPVETSTTPNVNVRYADWTFYYNPKTRGMSILYAKFDNLTINNLLHESENMTVDDRKQDRHQELPFQCECARSLHTAK